MAAIIQMLNVTILLQQVLSHLEKKLKYTVAERLKPPGKNVQYAWQRNLDTRREEHQNTIFNDMLYTVRDNNNGHDYTILFHSITLQIHTIVNNCAWEKLHR